MGVCSQEAGSESYRIIQAGNLLIFIVMKPSKKQTELAEKILKTTDKNILKHIEAVLDNLIQWEEETPEFVKQGIDEGLRDVRAGRVTPHAEVMKKYKKWLKK